MKLRLPAIVAGISALFVSFAVPAHASPAWRAQDLADAQAKKHEKTWDDIEDTWCEDAVNPRTDLARARKQVGDKRAVAYYQAFKLSPLDFGTYDPVNIARSQLFGHKHEWEPPSGSKEPDNIRMWRYLTCVSAESKAAWANYLVTANDKYGTKLGEQFDNDAEITELYGEKMQKMKTALLTEDSAYSVETSPTTR